MPDIAIGLMARYPRLNKVKTRLAKTLGDESALKVYKSLLSQSSSLITNLDTAKFMRTTFITPTDDCNNFKSEYPGFNRYYPQLGIDLGESMLNAFARMLSDSEINNAFLIGADCPELTPEIINEASELLSKHDLVLGPTFDGGYYLIGMKETYPDLFSGINWGSKTVMDKTLTVAHSLGLSVGTLTELRDLDDEEDYNYFVKAGLI